MVEPCLARLEPYILLSSYLGCSQLALSERGHSLRVRAWAKLLTLLELLGALGEAFDGRSEKLEALGLSFRPKSAGLAIEVGAGARA